MSEDLRFPIGQYEKGKQISSEERRKLIEEVSALPKKMREAVENLTDEQLDTPYRPDGWTVRQVVHHVGDSHMNSFIRFKLTLSEENPTIRPYEEDLWARTAEYKLPVEVSLKLIDSVHERWTALLESMSDVDFARTLNHPATGAWTLADSLGLYSWHGRHHTAHVSNLRRRNDW